MQPVIPPGILDTCKQTLMAKIHSSQIIKDGVELKAEKIDFQDEETKAVVNKSLKRQKQMLKSKKVDQKKLKLVVQL